MQKIICGDSLKILREMPDKSVDMILTDPPYEIGAKGCGLAGDRKYLHDITAQKLDIGFDYALLDDFERLCKKLNLVIFCSRLQLKPIMDWIYGRDCSWNLICWHKTDPTPLTNNNYLPDTEYIFHVWRDRKLTGSYDTKRKFYTVPREAKYGHPTAKPLEIISNLILNATNKGDVILDPFLGSGTTAVAAKRLGRGCIGIEISEIYCETARKRLSQESLFASVSEALETPQTQQLAI